MTEHLVCANPGFLSDRAYPEQRRRECPPHQNQKRRTRMSDPHGLCCSTAFCRTDACPERSRRECRTHRSKTKIKGVGQECPTHIGCAALRLLSDRNVLSEVEGGVPPKSKASDKNVRPTRAVLLHGQECPFRMAQGKPTHAG